MICVVVGAETALTRRTRSETAVGRNQRGLCNAPQEGEDCDVDHVEEILRPAAKEEEEEEVEEEEREVEKNRLAGASWVSPWDLLCR